MTGHAVAATVFIGLGSNLGDARTFVRAGGLALSRLPATSVVAHSALYRSAPVGRTDQQDFINAVCRLTTFLAPLVLLQSLLDIERAHGRLREGERGGPRTLDLDLLLYDGLTHNAAGLELPHPRMHERAFVLQPLVELDPERVVPGRGRARDLLAGCGSQRIERLEEW